MTAGTHICRNTLGMQLELDRILGMLTTGSTFSSAEPSSAQQKAQASLVAAEVKGKLKEGKAKGSNRQSTPYDEG